MQPIFRTLALAAMSLGAAMSAQAAPTVIGIDFNAQATTAGNTPTAITSADGFAFSGATVYNQSYFDSNYCCGFPNQPAVSGAGFIQNRFSNANADVNQRVEVAIDSNGALKGRDIESVTFSFTNGSTGMDFWAYDENGEHRFEYNPGQAWSWSTQTGNFSALGVVNRIAFVSKDSAATFSIDNFSFTLADTGVTPEVPEPAALGLVALALAAAGAATRKRRA
jgi:hypothetical protein